MVLNLEKKLQLDELLARPSLASQDHIPLLQELIDAYPYFQPLYLLLAKASSDTENKNLAFTKAALYTNGNVLHRILTATEFSLGENVNVINNAHRLNSDREDQFSSTPITSIPVSSSYTSGVTEAPEIENLEPLADELIKIDDRIEIQDAGDDKTLETLTEFALPEIENLEPLQSEVLKVGEIDQPEVDTEADEQPTFDEISELIGPPDFTWNEEQLKVDATESTPIDVEGAENEIQPRNISDEELIIETVAATDFFAFDKEFGTTPIAATESVHTPDGVENTLNEGTAKDKEHIVTKYDDDQLPFTFLWWLAKTRKDHDQIFRPFASPVTAHSQPLQQQYVEHIFHLQAPLEPTEENQVHKTFSLSKESKIIDNFIKNDPQIKALKPEQINNENKAKKSAEDTNDVVSETLAQIYIEQMLYHKAIDTYQKLSLKFPEKSGYFADLIQSLEKKI